MTTSLEGAADTQGAAVALTTDGPTPAVFVVGAGLVGTALAKRWVRAGVPVLGIHGRSRAPADAISSGALSSRGDFPDALSDAEVVVVAVKDARVPEIAQRLREEGRLRRRQVILQTSGSRAAGELLGSLRGEVAGVGTLHPLVAVSLGPALASFDGAAFGIEGDAGACRIAGALARWLGGKPLPLRADSMALYHTGAVIASNHVVALVALARAVFVAAGVPETDALGALLPLLASAVRNLEDVGLPGALTGPVVRGDVVSVERHVAALRAQAPELLDVYQRLGRETLRLAQQQRPDELDGEAVTRLATLFDGRADGGEARAGLR